MAHRNPKDMSLKEAIHYYGPLVDKVASKYHVSGTALLAKLIHGESGGRGNAVSSAGARGWAQFMPGTRKSFLDAYGVDAWRSPGEAVYAATLHLRGKGGHSPGLEGYNPGGGQQYVNYILGQSVGGLSGGNDKPTVQGGGSSKSHMASQGGTTTTKEEDPAATKRVALANYLLSRNPNNRLVKLGVLNPNEATTRTVTNSVSPSANSDPGSATGGSGSRVPSLGGKIVHSGGIPVARKGKVIGTPYNGTHNLGNWQSDNAVDIAVPVGTKMVALQDGVVVKVSKHPQDGGRFAGDGITVRGANGNEYFYKHGVASVKAGQKIRKGQVLGTTGSANGSPHLHFGQKKGDPREHT